MLFHDIHFALDEFANQPKLDIPLHFSDKLDTQSVYLRVHKISNRLHPLLHNAIDSKVKMWMSCTDKALVMSRNAKYAYKSSMIHNSFFNSYRQHFAQIISRKFLTLFDINCHIRLVSAICTWMTQLIYLFLANALEWYYFSNIEIYNSFIKWIFIQLWNIS